MICGVGIIIEYRFEHEPVLQLDAEAAAAGSSTSWPTPRAGARRPRPPLDRGPDALGRGGDRHDGDGAADRASSGSSLAERRWRRILYGLAIARAARGHARDAAQERADRARGGRRDAGVLPPARAAVAGAARAGHRGGGRRRLSPGAVHSVVGQFTAARRVQRGDGRATAPPTTTPSAPTCGRICCSAAASAATTTTPTGSSTPRSSGGPSRRASLGLVAFLLIGLTVILVARKTIASATRRGRRLALCGTAAAVCFLVISTLYDVMAFPHGTDTFLYMAGPRRGRATGWPGRRRLRRGQSRGTRLEDAPPARRARPPGARADRPALR